MKGKKVDIRLGRGLANQIKINKTIPVSQSTEHGAGWYVYGLMRTLLAVLYPDGRAYHDFFITHDTFFY